MLPGAWVAGHAARYAGARAASYLARSSVKRAAAAVLAGGAASSAYVGMKRKAPRQIQRGRKKARSNGVVASSAEYGMQSTRVRGSAKASVAKLAALSVMNRILRYQNVNGMNRVTGTAIPGALSLINSAGGAAATSEVPMHLYNINSTNNVSGGTYEVGLRTTFNDTGGVVFTGISGQSAAGLSGQSRWGLESVSESTTFTSSRHLLNQYVEMKFLLYGARAQPTVYYIDVVRFKDGYLDPLEIPSNAQEVQDRHGLYQELIRPLVWNPILNNGARNMSSKYETLHRQRVYIAPALSTQVDATPSSKMVKIFLPINKVYDYCYHNDGIVSDFDLSTTAAYAVQGNSTADYSDRPKARSRLWLIIRALNTTNTSTTSDNCPSYDIVLRKKEVMNA